MNYWLIKTEPSTYSWSDLVSDKETEWTGIRNYLARNNLRAMKNGDLAFVYHSLTDKAIVGVAKVVREAIPDSTATDGDWSMVRFKAEHELPHPITLESAKKDPNLKDMTLLKSSRLSVQPVTQAQWEHIMSKTS
ncbi:EVE domain-containing protein [Patescibacteria group bacterium]|nr:EVE domain-containing protein [Patescibacteria group bacterium]